MFTTIIIWIALLLCLFAVCGMLLSSFKGLRKGFQSKKWIMTPSQQQAQQASPALSVGNRFWFSYPVWTEVLYIREYLPSSNLIASVA